MNIYEYNSFFSTPGAKNLIRKAMSTGATSAGPLIEQHYETIITNAAIRLNPYLAVPEYEYDPQKVHRFTRRTALPGPGSAMGELAYAPDRTATREEVTKTLKVLQRRGGVSGFARAATKKNYDVERVELDDHIEAFANDLAIYFLYGNADADAYTFDGLDKFIATNRTNAAVQGIVPTDMSILDGMIDASRSKKSQGHRVVFSMSPFLLRKFSSLWTNVRDQRPAVRNNTDDIYIDGGYRLRTYDGYPIIEGSQTRPTEQMGTVVYSDAGSGGAISDDERFFRVAGITWDGEQEASAEVSGTSVNADTITLTWAANENCVYYKIYASDTTGTETLVKEISGSTYDGNGTPTPGVTSVTFTSEPLTPDSNSVPTHMQSDVPLVSQGGVRPEIIHLWDLDKYQGLGKIAHTNDLGTELEGFLGIEQLGKTRNASDFLLFTYMAMIDSYEATSAMYRGVRVS